MGSSKRTYKFMELNLRSVWKLSVLSMDKYDKPIPVFLNIKGSNNMFKKKRFTWSDNSLSKYYQGLLCKTMPVTL